MAKNVSSSDSQKSVNEIALQYMEEKYGEAFRYAGASGNSMTGNRTFYVTCDSFPDRRIKVRIENFSDEDRVFRDNYLVYKYEEDIRNLLTDCLHTEFSDVIVYFSVTGVVLSADIPGDASFEQVLHDPGLYISAKAEVRASELTSFDKVERALSGVTDVAAEYFISVLAVEESRFGQLTGEELDDRIRTKDYESYASLYRINGVVINDWQERGN